MRGKVAKQLKLYALEECMALQVGTLAWKFYKLLKQAHRNKKIEVRNGVAFWRSTPNAVVPMPSTHGTLTLG